MCGCHCASGVYGHWYCIVQVREDRAPLRARHFTQQDCSLISLNEPPLSRRGEVVMSQRMQHLSGPRKEADRQGATVSALALCMSLTKWSLLYPPLLRLL